MSVYWCALPRCTEEVTLSGSVCDICWFDRERQLDEMVDLYVRVHALLTPGRDRVPCDFIRMPQVGSAAPLNMAAFTTLEFATKKLVGWAVYLEAMRGRIWRGLAELPWGPAFAHAVHLLRRGDAYFAQASYAGDYVIEVYTAYRRLVELASPCESRRLRLPCVVCDCVSVVARNADEYAACLTCGTRWTQAQLLAVTRSAQNRIAC